MIPARPWPATIIGGILAIVGLILAILGWVGVFPDTAQTMFGLFILAFLAILL